MWLSKNYTKEQFIQAVKESYSYSEVCRKLGISPKGGNLNRVRDRIAQLHLDKSHFTGQLWSKGRTAFTYPKIKRKKLSDILTENSGWGSHPLKLRLFKEGIKKQVCERCGLTEWEGLPIPLELHHINGIHTDNRLENLQVLCPNCHALSDRHLFPDQKVLSAQEETPDVEAG